MEVNARKRRENGVKSRNRLNRITSIIYSLEKVDSTSDLNPSSASQGIQS